MTLREFEFESEGEYEGEQMLRRLLAGARQLGGRILSGMSSQGSAQQQPAARQTASPRGRGVVQSVGRRLIPTLVRLMATNHLDDPALPPEPAPVVAQDGRKRAGAGSPPEGEFEFSDAPRGRMTPPTLMRYLAREAERAQSEDEAEAFIGALVPLAAQAIRHGAPAVMRVAPQLISGLSQAASAMRRDPRTRALVRQLPAVAQRTAASIAQRAAHGGSVTPESATRSLARQLAYQHGLALRARGDAEYSEERPQRSVWRGGPFKISKPRPDTPRDRLRATAQQMRRTQANLRRTTQDLRDASDANLPYAATVPGQEWIW